MCGRVRLGVTQRDRTGIKAASSCASGKPTANSMRVEKEEREKNQKKSSRVYSSHRQWATEFHRRRSLTATLCLGRTSPCGGTLRSGRKKRKTTSDRASEPAALWPTATGRRESWSPLGKHFNGISSYKIAMTVFLLHIACS